MSEHRRAERCTDRSDPEQTPDSSLCLLTDHEETGRRQTGTDIVQNNYRFRNAKKIFAAVYGWIDKVSYKVPVLRAQQQIVHRLIWKHYITKNAFKHFACSMFVKLFNPFNMIFPLAGRQKACQLSCVPFPSITGNRYSWICIVNWQYMFLCMLYMYYSYLKLN